MLQKKDFRKQAHIVADMIADHLENIEQFRVKPDLQPGDIRSRLPEYAPGNTEAFADILKAYNDIIVPGITQWQHPGFMALFPSNASYESILAEMLVSGLAVNTMNWDTSPAATELEERMLEWLRDICGLPKHWKGVLQDTASIATLTACIAAREKATHFAIQQKGSAGKTLVVYCSDQTHYSIEKAAMSAGIGKENVIKIPTDEKFALRADLLEQQMQKDIADGKLPCMVAATLGTTNSLAFDPLKAIGDICNTYRCWLHVDAAYAGTAFILEEYRHYLDGIELADSYVFNPHKWMMIQFDCSAFYVKDPMHLQKVFSYDPEYLKKQNSAAINYKDWGIPLGRRFRALKIWFVLRSMGIAGLQEKIRGHITLAQSFFNAIKNEPKWEIMAPFAMNVLCIRHVPEAGMRSEQLNAHNKELLQKINADGRFDLSGTTLRGEYVIRVVIGQSYVEEKHVESLIELLLELSASS